MIIGFAFIGNLKCFTKLLKIPIEGSIFEKEIDFTIWGELEIGIELTNVFRINGTFLEQKGLQIELREFIHEVGKVIYGYFPAFGNFSIEHSSSMIPRNITVVKT